MKDRVSANPGRVKLTPEDGSPAFYATMERADNPVEEGTPLNKSTLLSDAACDLLDIPQTSTVNEAFLKLALGVGKYGYTVHFQWPDGSPMVGYRVNGLTAIDGSALTTDDTGTVFGVSENTSVGVSVRTSFQDLNTASKTIRSTGILTEDTVKITSKSSFTLTANSSQSYQFSQWAPLVDICAVGGGGSGGSASGFSGNNDISVGAASGGAGGEVKILENYNPAGKTLTVSIGAGGEGVRYNDVTSPANGSSGGTTTVKSGNTTVLSASGGDGGKAASESEWNGSGNKSVSARASGASGGSGSGGCRAEASSRSSSYWASGAGASGSNGEDGEAGIAEDDDGGTHGSAAGGKGQGKTTAFNGTTYSAAGGGAAYAFYSSGNEHESETAAGGSGAGAGHAGANGGNATQKGAGGGGSVSIRSNSGTSGTSGAGADGRVIIKKAS